LLAAARLGSIRFCSEPESDMSEARPTVFIDNDRVIVTEWRFAPGASTGWHRHGHDYVVVPLMDGKLKLVTKDGESVAVMK